MCIATAI